MDEKSRNKNKEKKTVDIRKKMSTSLEERVKKRKNGNLLG